MPMLSHLLSGSSHTIRYPLPIFGLLTGLLLMTTTTALMAAPSWLGAAVAVGLVGGHLMLHWGSAGRAADVRRWLQYTLAQGGLGIGLTLLTESPSVWSVVFTWLVGETIGMVSSPRTSALSLGLYGALGLAALFAITDRQTALSWLGATLPTVLFVGVVVVLYKRQVEAREEAQALVVALEEANRQISAYAARVEALTLSNERQRMARELHDTLAQDVAGLALQLEAVSAHLAAQRHERAQAIVQQAMGRARATLRDARAAIDDLRARESRAHLSEQLESLCQRFQAESEIPCTLTVEAGPWDAALPTAHKEQLERIASEALANIHKHARATEVRIHLRADGRQLLLQVQDNGIGFQTGAVPIEGHYGLRGLHERARLLGGTVHIESAPGQGTTIGLAMPLATLIAGEQPSPLRSQSPPTA